jgi:hypothetical protein
MLHWRFRGIVRWGDKHNGVVHGYILVPHYFSFFLLGLNLLLLVLLFSTHISVTGILLLLIFMVLSVLL